MNYTFIFLKPDALERQLVGKITKRFTDAGLHLAYIDYKVITEDLIFEHYAHKIVELGDVFKTMTKNSFVGKAVIPIIIESESPDLVKQVRAITGATFPENADKGTIRGDFGIDLLSKATEEVRCCDNLIHASDSLESFEKECRLWFSDEVFELFSQ